MTEFLQTPNELSNKKKRQINKSKWKRSIRESRSREVIISYLDSFDKKELSVSILVTIKS